jgi:hypothetical protein
MVCHCGNLRLSSWVPLRSPGTRRFLAERSESRDPALQRAFCSAGASGNCGSVRRHYSVVKKSALRLGRIADRQNNIGPCFGAGPGDRPHFLSSVSLTSRGMARRQGARPGSPDRRWHGLRPGPGRPAPCGAPTRHLRLTPQSALGPRQELCVPGGFLPRPPVGQVCVNAPPAGAAPDPPPCERLRKAPLELGPG